MVSALIPPLVVPHLPAGDFSLRAWSLRDLGLVREASADPYIPRITTVPSVYSEAAAVSFVQRQWQRAASGEGFTFVIVRNRDDRAVGAASFRPLGEGRASLGYWVAASARGQGAALSAVRAMSTWGLSTLGLDRLELYVEPWNTGSLRTAERAGFHREGLLRGWREIGGERRDMVMYALLPGDI
ncbi:GNAT family N-acetyltransferase [Streptantibioticus ferralitis]|uniref:GNAT family protein n=1 Tax=Streptantibioticus ferralitis TaxID=236510 RepID=A0ABT5Z2Y3_9ACTN|nr:GNAT family protein [Streptantibioticus ferralitis]MDF2258192.1 GNAT family protein [Streptantibioticus ferralitis]